MNDFELCETKMLLFAIRTVEHNIYSGLYAIS